MNEYIIEPVAKLRVGDVFRRKILPHRDEPHIVVWAQFTPARQWIYPYKLVFGLLTVNTRDKLNPK
jgi:hypothetical protein